MSQMSDQTQRAETDALIDVRNLKKHFPIKKGLLKKEVGRVRAVDGISFSVKAGETFGLVGESGCGKSTAAESILRLTEPTEGDVYFDGNDITEYGEKDLKRFRREAQMIFQNPDSSFDPRMSIGESISEPLRIHGVGPRERRLNIAQDLLERVGMDADDAHRYPHELSGGQKQRAALARALVVNPRLIIADEPVSALDVSVQAEVLQLLKDIQDEFDLSVIFISHDMSVVQEVCDRIAVMYLGKIVEMGPTEEIFQNPQHPYTRALLDSVPTMELGDRSMDGGLRGEVPNPSNPPSGCNFHTRCPEVIQPEGFDLDQEKWRRIMDLRVALRQRRIDVDELQDFVGVTEGEVPTGEEYESMKEELRHEHDVPMSLGDADAEDTLEAAIDHIVKGETTQAQELLAEEFETVCETQEPELADTDAGQPAACHLHTEIGAPLSGTADD